jgi:RNA polymerase sigma-54 factor
MALTQRLELRQGQSLVMTPQLQQAIKLLQMSNLELQEFVESELECNPLLEREDVGDHAVGGTDAPAPERTNETSGRSENSASAVPGATDSGWASLRPSRGVSLDGVPEFGATLAREKTLQEHLTEQLAISVLSATDKLIAHHLIGMLNEAGYLVGDCATAAELLGTNAAHVERVLLVLQGFDPAGVFARDVKECLSLQLEDQDRLDPVMSRLVANLELVAKRDFDGLRAICKADAEDLRDMVAELRRLNPKPGHLFGSEPVQPVLPDVFVRAAPDGTWLIELNSETLPRVLVNNRYHSQVSRSAREEDKTYLTECHSNATWLVRSLDQRAKTILKVAREIVRQQDGFLINGIQHLRPLNLKAIADAIEMHESTVSRVTSNKYMATPRGIFELKFFFTTAIASAEGGEAHSAEAVRHRIKELIAQEDGENILSDDTIVEVLRRDGIEIARRTVAKYRESLNIPSSVQRRREARAFGGARDRPAR